MFLVITIVLIGAAFVAFWQKGSRAWLRYVLLVGAVIVINLTSLDFGLSLITGSGVDDSVFYHLKTGLSGGDVSQYSTIVIALCAVSVFLGSGLFLLLRNLQMMAQVHDVRWNGAIIGLVATAVLFHPVSVATMKYLFRFSLAEQKQGGYHIPVASSRPDRAQNLVLVYLEGLEQTYFDAGKFPNLVPELTAIRDRGVSFSDVGQTIGAGFTIGGMVAGQCGVPLILTGGVNSMKVNRFLAGAHCLGDFLHEEGYDLSYIGGASLEFAGKGAFYKSHEFSRVEGLDELLSQVPDPTYRAEWGLQDDTLFDLALERVAQSGASDQPFALSVLTLDTHHPSGHANTNRSCRGIRYQDGSNPMLNSVKCTDFLIGDFVRRIQSGPGADETVIVIVSDHLGLGNSATHLLEQSKRRNTFIILNPNQTEPRTIQKPATTLDVGPTILSALGFGVERMGFGVNLLGDAAPLPQELQTGNRNDRKIDRHLMGFQSVYTRLWDYPGIEQGLYVNLEKSEAQFGAGAFAIPAVMSFDQNQSIDDTVIFQPTEEQTLTEAVLDLPDGKSFLWFDRCLALDLLVGETGEPNATDMCVAFGKRNVALDVQHIHRSGYFSPDHLKEWLGGSTTKDAVGDLAQLTRVGQLRGDLPLRVPSRGISNLGRGVILQSASFGAGASFVRRLTVDSHSSGEDWILKRGVTLVGIDHEGRAEEIQRLDNCNQKAARERAKPWGQIVQKNQKGFHTYAVLAHDTAFCGKFSGMQQRALSGLPLKRWKTVEMRQPYVGVIQANGNVFEYPNFNFSRVRILLDPTGASDAAPMLMTQVVDHPLELAAAARIGNNAQHKRRADTDMSIAATVPNAPVSCISPNSQEGTEPSLTLGLGDVLVGQDIEPFIGFRSGWWGTETAGRWAGSKLNEFTVILPEAQDTSLFMALQLASPNNAGQSLRVTVDGRERYSGTLREFQNIRMDVTDLPRGIPVSIKAYIDEKALSCPKSLSQSNDPRNLAFMLQSVSVFAGTQTSQFVEEDRQVKIAHEQDIFRELHSIQDVSGEQDQAPQSQVVNSEMPNGCIRPNVPSLVAPPQRPLPISKPFSFGKDAANELVSFGAGWWSPEASGRWIGEHPAEFFVILPEGPIELQLAFNTVAFDDEFVAVSVRYRGKKILTQLTGAQRPLKMNLSGLPRGKPILLTVEHDEGRLDCPKSLGTAADPRAMSFMLISGELTVPAPFSMGPAIAHGAGRLKGVSITNSFEALQSNKDRFDVFEIDLNWTSDGELVCIHDWESSFTYRFSDIENAPIPHGQFRRALANSVGKPRNCDIEGLAGWMRANPHVRIVTDVKQDPIQAHRIIADRHPDLMPQFVPQAYQPAEITAYRELGFNRIAWTLYKFGRNPDRILAAIEDARPDAIVMPISFALSGLIQTIQTKTKIPVYVHTVNDPELAACMMALGAAGLYSDSLGKEDIENLPKSPDDCQMG